MGYHIANMSFSKLYYISKNVGLNSSDVEVKFDVRRRVNKGGYRIDELDYFTSQKENEKSFYEALVQEGLIDKTRSMTKDITLFHTKSGGQISKDDIIYGDKMVAKTALNYVAQKIKKAKYETNDEIMVDDSAEVLEFIDYIKKLTLDKESSKYIIGPYPHYYDENDKLINLGGLISNDIYNKGKLCVEGLQSLLRKFVIYNNRCDEAEQNGEDVLETRMALNSINQKIDTAIRSRYLVFRNLIVWEQRYEKVLKKELENETNPKQQNVLSVLLDEIKFQRDYRNGKITKDILDLFYSEKRDRLDYVPTKKEYLNNDEMEQLYMDGGIENVMINMDTDVLYSTESNIKDIEILSKREQNESSFHGKK
ncbi:MAG: hypothetical protein Q4E39_04905 [bacterium]|nr:hypothetical protein [bacterium]